MFLWNENVWDWYEKPGIELVRKPALALRRGFVGSQAGIHGLTAAAHAEGALVPICKVPGIGNGTSRESCEWAGWWVSLKTSGPYDKDSFWLFFFGFSLFASFLKQPGFESKPLNKPDPTVHSPFSKVILICIKHTNKNNCPQCRYVELSRMFLEK